MASEICLDAQLDLLASANMRFFKVAVYIAGTVVRSVIKKIGK